MKLYTLDNQFIEETSSFPFDFTGIIEYCDGTKHWYVEGNLHRLDGPACEYSGGHKEWWVDGKRHRLDSPAIECYNGTKHWYVEGNLHRLDGPASEWADGIKDWWIDNKEVTEEHYNLLISIMKLKGLL